MYYRPQDITSDERVMAFKEPQDMREERDYQPLPDPYKSEEGSFAKGLAWGVFISTIVWALALGAFLHAS